MSSLIYDACLYNVFRSIIHFDIDHFKVLLVSSQYIPNKNHSKRSDIFGEIPNEGGYTKDGMDTDVLIKKDPGVSRINIILGEVSWKNVTIVAAGAVYYKLTGRGAANDDLISFVGFDKEASSTNGSFTITPSIIRIQS